MATAVFMPRQGNSVESCIIGKLYKQKGDAVQVGDLIFSYETDKATFDEESKVSGILLDIYYGEGDEVPCMTNVCVIGEAGENTNEFNPHQIIKDTEVTAENAAIEEKTASIESIHDAPSQDFTNGHIGISPRAKKLAETSHVDYRLAIPTGPYGRIMERDVQMLKDQGSVLTPAAYTKALTGNSTNITGTGLGGRITTGDLSQIATEVITDTVAPDRENHIAYEDLKLSNIRKVIAKAMHASLSNTAQLTIHNSFDASAILTYREQLKNGKEAHDLENITVNDLVLYAVSRTLLDFKNLNAHFMGDSIRYFNSINLGVAVDTERGLLVPTILKAEGLSLNNLSKTVKSLANACQTGTINPDLLKGGSFTVTNLGSLGVEFFTPVLNAPQVAILGVNTISPKAKTSDSGYEFYPAMGLSLTFDHQAVDGAPAAKFLQTLCKNLEHFNILLAK